MVHRSPPLIRRSDVISVLVYIALLAILTGVLYLAWPTPNWESGSRAQVITSGITGPALLVALLIGVPAIVRFPFHRRRILALAEILANVECVSCNARYDPMIVSQTAHEVCPFCGGDPANEDLRPRWLVQCGSCGAWSGFGDDCEPIQGGVVPVPKSR